LQDQNEIDKSLSLYKKSIELNPSDIDSKINYEILNQEGEQDQQNAENQEGEQDQQNAENQDNKNLKNKEKEAQTEKEKTDQMMQAEAILNAIKGQEKINQKHKILKSKAYKYEKDW
jgi:hypothetical protein